MYNVCTNCGLPSLNVDFEVVKNFVKEDVMKVTSNNKWSVCVNSNCEVSYFNKNETFTLTDLNKTLFFKNESPDTLICYCSYLTRGEIQYAVKNGCKTIDAVRSFTGKTTMSNCKTNNPLGQCCHGSFQFEINKALKNHTDGFSFTPSKLDF